MNSIKRSCVPCSRRNLAAKPQPREQHKKILLATSFHASSMSDALRPTGHSFSTHRPPNLGRALSYSVAFGHFSPHFCPPEKNPASSETARERVREHPRGVGLDFLQMEPEEKKPKADGAAEGAADEVAAETPSPAIAQPKSPGSEASAAGVSHFCKKRKKNHAHLSRGTREAERRRRLTTVVRRRRCWTVV